MAKSTDLNVKAGQTEVAVWRVEEDGKGGFKAPCIIHKGFVIQNCGSFVRVFSPKKRDQGGDLNPIVSELFPVAGKRSWIEVVGERKPVDAFPIPCELRF